MSKKEEIDDTLARGLVPLTDFDMWTAGDACEGTVITGTPGCGKTSTSGKEIALSFLEAGYGGLVLCHKTDEPETWLSYCQRTGREKDVILFSRDSGHCYDPLYYEWNRPGKGAGDVETLVEMLSMLMGSGGTSSDKDGSFWEGGNKKLMRHSIKLLGLAQEPVSVDTMNRVIGSLPHGLAEAQSDEFKTGSYSGQLIQKVAARGRTQGLTEGEWSDFQHAEWFMTQKWPDLARETASSIEMHWDVLADQLLFEPFKTIFSSGKCTLLPEQVTHTGKIVIVAFPTLEYGETGTLINRMMKVSFQKAFLRRDVRKNRSLAFLWQDEFQTFCMRGSHGTNWDNSFQQVCRQYRIANVCITQNILNLAEVLGESTPGARTKSFLGNLSLRIMHQQNCVDTNNYCADLIGKEYQNLFNKNWSRYDVNTSTHQQLIHRVEPADFSALRKPDSMNPIAEAIVWWGGREFLATGVPNKGGLPGPGKSYIKRLFSRDI